MNKYIAWLARRLNVRTKTIPMPAQVPETLLNKCRFLLLCPGKTVKKCTLNQWIKNM